MPGPYHIALAKPTIKQTKEGNNEYYHQEIILGLSQNYQDSRQQTLWQFWSVKGGAYPYWFLSPTTFEMLNGGNYMTVPPSYLAQNPQVLYVFQNYAGFAQIYVNTPQLDPPGIYAVFESNKWGRDNAFCCSGEDTFYLCHRKWPEENDVMLLRKNVLQSMPKPRL